MYPPHTGVGIKSPAALQGKSFINKLTIRLCRFWAIENIFKYDIE
jgi:hypothetical protein